MHVLFVHGVGMHSRLSSLLQAYQALRSDTRSHEAPIGLEDPIPGWHLEQFADSDSDGPTPRLKLANAGETTAVYLYEVNYSALAGVVRGNQPLDLTALFVGFDLAVNIARARLAGEPPARQGASDIDHGALALIAQKLGGVFVAATVPILGIPSLVFRRFTQSLVAVFSRFFEDIATFALDMNGTALISAHVDRTVCSIVESGLFKGADADHSRDRLVFVAHSLGTVVAHSHIVRHRFANNPGCLPDRMLSFGAPIGLVSWLWRFLDFEAMDFQRPIESRYFTWNPLPAPPVEPPTMLWINVVNQLDPIATAFAADDVMLSQSGPQNRASLAGGRIHQRFIDTGDMAGAAHTAYFHDRSGFLEILSRIAGLRVGRPEAVIDPDTGGRTAQQHWRETAAHLAMLRRLWWALGLAAIALYLGGVAWLSGHWIVLALLPVFAYPPATIGTLAFFQRLICSRPTKRTSIVAIEQLPWHDLRAKPHRLRQAWRRPMTPEAERDYVMAAASGPTKKVAMWLASFAPTLFAMLLPFAVAARSADDPHRLWQQFIAHPGLTGAAALQLFTAYLVAFTISEFVAHWRNAVTQLTQA
jgi:hypothetical protein